MIDLRAGGRFATAALSVALLGLYPSVAPFTPAVLLSILAGAVGIFAMTAGAWRRGVVTIQLAVVAIVGSPMMPFHRLLESRGWLFWEWYLGALAISAATAAVLYLGYSGKAPRRASR
jgi:hypothetical protein